MVLYCTYKVVRYTSYDIAHVCVCAPVSLQGRAITNYTICWRLYLSWCIPTYRDMESTQNKFKLAYSVHVFYSD